MSDCWISVLVPYMEGLLKSSVPWNNTEISFGFRDVCKKGYLFGHIFSIQNFKLLYQSMVHSVNWSPQSECDFSLSRDYRPQDKWKKLEKILKLITIKSQYNTTPFVTHTTVLTTIPSYTLCLFTDLKLQWTNFGYYEHTWYQTLLKRPRSFFPHDFRICKKSRPCLSHNRYQSGIAHIKIDNL
jgi:hypothetical protein